MTTDEIIHVAEKAARERQPLILQMARLHWEELKVGDSYGTGKIIAVSPEAYQVEFDPALMLGCARKHAAEEEATRRYFEAGAA